MTDTTEDNGEQDRNFAKALFRADETDETDETDDEKTVTPEPEPEPDDHQFTRIFFNPTEGH